MRHFHNICDPECGREWQTDSPALQSVPSVLLTGESVWSLQTSQLNKSSCWSNSMEKVTLDLTGCWDYLLYWLLRLWDLYKAKQSNAQYRDETLAIRYIPINIHLSISLYQSRVQNICVNVLSNNKTFIDSKITIIQDRQTDRQSGPTTQY